MGEPPPRHLRARPIYSPTPSIAWRYRERSTLLGLAVACVIVIRYLIAAPVVVFLVLLVYGGLTGRVRLQAGCCCPPDPKQDLRIQAPEGSSTEPRTQ